MDTEYLERQAYNDQRIKSNIENAAYLNNMPSDEFPSEILKLELDFEKSLEDLKHKLSGEYYIFDEKTQTKRWIQTEKAWMNAEGISKIVGIIRGHVDVNTFLSFLETEDINIITLNIADELATILANKNKQFEVDPVYLGTIHSIIVNNIFFALKRAWGAKTLLTIHSSTHRVESSNIQNDQQKQKGFIRRLI